LREPPNSNRAIDGNRARYVCEKHRRLSRLQGVRIGRDLNLRRLVPSRVRADLAADTDELSAPPELDDRRELILAGKPGHVNG
jgi:hypothetical protein